MRPLCQQVASTLDECEQARGLFDLLGNRLDRYGYRRPRVESG
jgi:hypothetical protein